MSSRFRIGELTLDTGRRLLLCNSKAIPLGPLTYRLLLALVEGAPNVVSHDELAAKIWAGRPVSPETISQRIKLLRDALSDDPHHPRYVELVRGQGYRLVPLVEALPEDARVRDWARWIVPISIAIVLVIAAASGLWITMAPTSTVRDGGSFAQRQSRSIAVLPFADLSPAQDQQYLADGIAEEILNLLSKATSLRVVARTSSFSFRSKDADIASIAEALGVTHVLEGSVRKEEDRIRVTVRLVDASDGSRVWSESYDQQLGHILALQSDIARSVAAQLKASLEHVTDVAVRRVNAEAYELYLHGQLKLRLMSLNEAARFFERAIAIDPEFVPSYYGLGAVYVLQIVDVQVSATENRDRLRDIVRRGLQLAPDDPGLLALSAQLARYDGDIPLAEERFAIALQRDPANSVLRLVYPIFKLDQGYPDESLALNRRSIEIDPLNPHPYINTWASHMDRWNVQEAMAAAAHFRALSPESEPWRDVLTTITRWYLLGDLAGSKSYITAAAARLRAADTDIRALWLPQLYYFIDDLQSADALMELARPIARNAPDLMGVEAYRHLAHGDVHAARRLAVSALTAPKKIWGGNDEDFIIVRLATDAMIESGEAQEAVAFLETLAPEYVHYKSRKDIDPKNFWPAPVAVKSAFSSYPALYFPDYIRALRAVGDEPGASQMLQHMEAILELCRKRGLFLEERHAAEALALRGQTDAALNALEKAERDRTIYHRWHLVLLHNEIFADLRDHPRFVALVERIRRDLSRQREELSRIDETQTHAD